MLKVFTRIKNRYIFRKEQSNAADIIAAWELNGRPVPAPGVQKRQVIKAYQQQYNAQTLVETGTFLGDMIAAQLPYFKKLISIELSDRLYREACNRFKNNTNVELFHGDSGKVLPQILPSITSTAIFWLDGHYSAGITALGDKESPIIEELQAILQYDLDHILLIDDAREFTGKGGYPTIPELERLIKSKNPHYTIEVKDDIIRAVVKR